MTELRISDTLALPVEAALRATAVLAVRGAGKTYTAAVLAEEAARAELPFVMIDPVGVGWGLAYDAVDSKKRGGGLPVVIFGGDHADVPLEETAGELIADVIVRERFSAVLDLSLLRKGARKRFVLDFLEKLYDANREPLVLVVDEADMFAPQKPLPGDQRLVGSMEDVVRRGRAHGIGVYLISQRPAVINKDVLTQCEMLIVLRITHPKDRDAIDDWIELHGTAEQRAAVVASLPTLKQGEAWVWSPPYDLLQRVQVRRRTTFDSSATPKPGEKRVEPTKRAAVDIDALRATFVATIERAKADDPKALRAELVDRAVRIAELESRLAAAVRPEAPAPEPLEVPLLTDEVRVELRDAIEWLDRVVGKLADGIEVARRPVPGPVPTVWRPDPVRQRPTTRTAAPPAPARPSGEPPTDDAKIPGTAVRVLEIAAAFHPRQMTRRQLATIAGVSPTTGSFKNYLSVLRTRGLMESESDLVEITRAGLALVGRVAKPTSTAEVVELFAAEIGNRPLEILHELVTRYPRPIPREQIAAALGVSMETGSFKNYLSVLRCNDLIGKSTDGEIAASWLFEYGGRRA